MLQAWPHEVLDCWSKSDPLAVVQLFGLTLPFLLKIVQRWLHLAMVRLFEAESAAGTFGSESSVEFAIQVSSCRCYQWSLDKYLLASAPLRRQDSHI